MKNHKQKSVRVKGNRKDYEIKSKCNFLIKQNFMNKNIGTYDYFLGKYHQNLSVSKTYKKFKQSHYKPSDYYKRREYTHFPKRFFKVIEKTTKELEAEKKYFNAKTLYSNDLSFNNVFRYCNMLSVSEAELLSICLIE